MTASFISAAEDRPLMLRSRPDLQWSWLAVRGGSVAVANDSVGVREWFLKADEAWLCSLITPSITWRQLQREWEKRYRPRRVQLSALEQIVQRLFQSGLLLTDISREPTQYDAIHEEDKKNRRGKWWSNLLTLYGPGVNPTSLLNSIGWVGNWLMSRAAIFVLTALCIIALGIVARDWSLVRMELSRLTSYGPMRSIVTWLAVISVVKVLHELGHAVIARACGVRCHTIGLLVLCGIPTLYCQIGNVWTASRRQRLWINAGGMIVELWLAALGIIVWANSIPGTVHDLGLQVSLLTIVSVFLLNGNPLLRYDGYYLLSDGVAIPNLREQATQVTATSATKLFGVADEQPRATLQEHSRLMRMMLVAYSVTSTIYRWVLAWGLVWFVAQWLAPHGLTSPKWLLGAVFLLLFAGLPLVQFWKWARHPRHTNPLTARKFFLRLGLVAMFVVPALIVRFPASVSTHIVIEPARNTPITSTAAGRLQMIIAPGTIVEDGDEIALLHNPELEQERSHWQGEYELSQLRVANLERRQDDPKAAAQLTTALAAVNAAKQQLDEFERQVARLTVRAHQSGRYFPPERQVTESKLVNTSTGIPREPTGAPITSWHGNLNDPKNLGAWLAVGTNIGSIGDAKKSEAWGILDQADLGLVKVGQKVRLRVHSMIDREIMGRVLEIAAVPVEKMNSALWEQMSSKFEVQNHAANETDSSGGLKVKPIASSYYVRIECDSSDGLAMDSIGHAKIEIGSLSLFERAFRWFVHTFQFEF